MALSTSLLLQDNIRKIGPWGGSGGKKWDMARVDATTRINKIVICHGGAIDSIAFQYQQNGVATLFPSKGGNGGKPSEIILQTDEFLTSIQGHWSAFSGFAGILRLLTLVSNFCRYGPFGEDNGTPFSLLMPNVEIVGFHGSSGQYLDAIGIYVVAHNHLISPQENVRILGPLSGFGERKWGNEREDSTPHIKSIVIRQEQVIDLSVLENNQVASVCLFPSKEGSKSQPAECRRGPDGSIPPQDELWITARKAAEPNSLEVILTVHQLALQQPDLREDSNSSQPGPRSHICGAKRHDDVRGRGGLATTPVDSLFPSSIVDAEVMGETRELQKMVASLQTQLVDMQKVITQLLQSNIGSSGRADPQASTSRVGDSHDKDLHSMISK